MPKVVLTPEDKVAIVSAPGAGPTALAAMLGRPFTAVAQFRSRVARAGGWYTPLSPRTCRACERPLIASGHRRLHGTCRDDRSARRKDARRSGHRRDDALPSAPPRTGRLTGEEMVAVATAGPDVGHAQLARSMGRRPDLVAAARNKVRRAGGWYCRLGLTPCLVCALPVAKPRATLHPRCTPARMRAHQERWRRLESSPEQRAGARWSKHPWLPEEDRILLDGGMPYRDVAALLERTPRAVRTRRARLLRASGEWAERGTRRGTPERPRPQWEGRADRRRRELLPRLPLDVAERLGLLPDQIIR